MLQLSKLKLTMKIKVKITAFNTGNSATRRQMPESTVLIFANFMVGAANLLVTLSFTLHTQRAQLLTINLAIYPTHTGSEVLFCLFQCSRQVQVQTFTAETVQIACRNIACRNVFQAHIVPECFRHIACQNLFRHIALRNVFQAYELPESVLGTQRARMCQAHSVPGCFRHIACRNVLGTQCAGMCFRHIACQIVLGTAYRNVLGTQRAGMCLGTQCAGMCFRHIAC